MISDSAKRVLRIEAEAITGLIDRIDHRFEHAIEILDACRIVRRPDDLEVVVGKAALVDPEALVNEGLLLGW